VLDEPPQGRQAPRSSVALEGSHWTSQVAGRKADVEAVPD
jgi:hypothetical protein